MFQVDVKNLSSGITVVRVKNSALKYTQWKYSKYIVVKSYQSDHSKRYHNDNGLFLPVKYTK